MNPKTEKAVVTKAIAEIVPGTDDATTPNGTFEVILSAETKDRDDETLRREDWKQPLPDHITFDTDHGMSVASTVGSGAPRIEADGTLRVSGEYSSIARGQEIRTLVNEGHIRTTSVAFLTTSGSKAAGRKTRELLNGAFVAVPSNRDTVVLSSKAWAALEDETAVAAKAGARNSATDASRLQSIHDLATEAGATCSGAKASPLPETKSFPGSYEDRQQDLRQALVEANTEALAAAYPHAEPGDYSWRVSILATFPDRVVYRLGYDDTDDAFEVAYSWDGDAVTITGTAAAVTVEEIVKPAPAEAKSQTAADPAAPSGPAGSTVASDEVAVKAATIRAYAALI